MKYFFYFTLIGFASTITAETNTSNTHQYYSGKIGFYAPDPHLNNGLMVGIDGITEFKHYNFFLGAALDVYLKQTLAPFTNTPPPTITQQMLLLFPLHANAGFQVLNIADADTKFYLGAGLGYYFAFYNADYKYGNSGFLGGSSSGSGSWQGGNIFGTAFARIIISKIFLEPRLYFAKTSGSTFTGGQNFSIDPSGFALSFGYQN